MDSLNYVQTEKKDDLCILLNKGSIYKLYKDCFSEPPYEEVCNEIEINDLFLQYFEKGILVFCFEENKGNTIGFAAATPLKYESEISNLAKNYGYNSSTDWYYADLGVAKEYRGKGIGQQLAKNLIQLIPADRIIMRTQENNTASQNCHKKVGFQIIDGMYQYISRERISGKNKIDKRIFLFYDKKLKGE